MNTHLLASALRAFADALETPDDSVTASPNPPEAVPSPQQEPVAALPSFEEPASTQQPQVTREDVQNLYKQVAQTRPDASAVIGKLLQQHNIKGLGEATPEQMTAIYNAAKEAYGV